MSCSCHSGRNESRTIRVHSDGTIDECECLILPVGARLDWVFDFSEFLCSACSDANDIHIVDQANSSAIISHIGGPTPSSATVNNVEFDDEKMTVWIDGQNTVNKQYYQLDVTMTSDKGRVIRFCIQLQTGKVTC